MTTVTASADLYDVRVPGGALRVARWGRGPHVVVAAHGLTATHLHFAALADQLGDLLTDQVTLLAPDLRGRGRSADIAGPFGMVEHADDLASVLKDADADNALLVGHSMGGFVAAVAADRHPDLVRELVLVDGGLPLDLTGLEGLPIDEVVRAITGPALDRLRLRFESVPAYLDHWRRHPALVADWNGYIERAYAYDLVGEPPELRSSCREDAVLADSASELQSGDVERALDRLTQPTVLLRAPRGIMDTDPLYSDDIVVRARARVPHLADILVPDVNHYTILFTDRGAAAVAGVVRARLDAGR